MESCTFFTATQTQFLAEDEPITIYPTVSFPQVRLISGNVGPFKPNEPQIVPLWLALMLRQRRKCIIEPPNWFTKEYLTALRDRERQDKNCFIKLPSYHFIEIAVLLLENAESDVIGQSKTDEMRSLLEDLWSERENKLRTGLLLASKEDTIISIEVSLFCRFVCDHSQMTNLTAMEITTVCRPHSNQSTHP
eukprot:TRINITY_DN4312_c0_g2_i8.p1 TRINITY_DN4312_c0_g2~~TRINITY_DN4312_c0_g2_i8.p1  ORF type:complete len:192 (-),score=26.94 TRINITY_DN4312_c0_g2_i8:450-1025(-)